MLCKNPIVPGGADIKTDGVPVACGQCLHCRINNSNIWKNRLLLEQRSHKKSCFVTLTYNDLELPIDIDAKWRVGDINALHYSADYPPPHTLAPRDLQLFIKRLRRLVEPQRIRYFAAGEYGMKGSRAHYHLIIFGLDILDRLIIEKAWGLGVTHTGDLEPASARYVTKYIIKGMTKFYCFEPWMYPEFMRSSKGRKNGGLGKEAVLAICNCMKSKPFYRPERIHPDGLRKKGKPLHIGRYLKENLQSVLGYEVEDYRGELYQEFGFGGKAVKGIQSDKKLKQRRLNQEKRSKIFKGRETL